MRFVSGLWCLHWHAKVMMYSVNMPVCTLFTLKMHYSWVWIIRIHTKYVLHLWIDLHVLWIIIKGPAQWLKIGRNHWQNLIKIQIKGRVMYHLCKLFGQSRHLLYQLDYLSKRLVKIRKCFLIGFNLKAHCFRDEKFQMFIRIQTI